MYYYYVLLLLYVLVTVQYIIYTILFAYIKDGCIRISVSREHILKQSMLQFNNLKMEELHRFMRIQFAGEQGIDAGGLEREWFQIGRLP